MQSTYRAQNSQIARQTWVQYHDIKTEEDLSHEMSSASYSSDDYHRMKGGKVRLLRQSRASQLKSVEIPQVSVNPGRLA